jgi:hypothetical protein
MQTKTKFIIFIVLTIIVVIGIGFFINKYDSNKTGKLDQFAKALKEKGAVFYGAFWCTHCQAQKAEFGTSKKYLPYVECATPDDKQVQICKDNKIEGYPTWSFPNPIKLTSSSEPLVCPIVPEGEKPTESCLYTSSKYFKVWVFQGYKFSVRSSTDPVKNGDNWEFPAGAQTSGEVPLSFLAEQIGFTLPQ